jgi:hypothetical protein
VDVLLVLGGLYVLLPPVVPPDGGGSHDESGEHLGVLLLDLPHPDGAVERGVGLEVAHYLTEFAVGVAQAVLVLRDLHDAPYHTVVVLLDDPLLEQVEGRRGGMLELGVVVVIEMALGSQQVDEVLLLGVGALDDFQAFLVVLEVPDVRVHLEYRII